LAWRLSLAELKDVVCLFESGGNQIDDDLVIENIFSKEEMHGGGSVKYPQGSGIFHNTAQ
jgi:hypothetical protein